MIDPLEQIAEREGKRKNWVVSGNVKYFSMPAVRRVTGISLPTLHKYMETKRIPFAVGRLAKNQSGKRVRKFMPEADVRRILPENRFLSDTDYELKEKLRKEGEGVYEIILKENYGFDPITKKLFYSARDTYGEGLRTLHMEIRSENLGGIHLNIISGDRTVLMPYDAIGELKRVGNLPQKKVEIEVVGRL